MTETSTDTPKEYPYTSGDFIVIGPECFANAEGTVISWRGGNFYGSCDHKVADLENGGASHCVKRQDHPGVRHEDFEGNTYDEIYGSAPEEITIPIPRLGVMDDGTPILVSKLDVRAAYDAFVAPTQQAREPMTPETRTVAALLRAVNEALPTVAATDEVDEKDD